MNRMNMINSLYGRVGEDIREENPAQERDGRAKIAPPTPE
jgi:hypothetical protein